MSPEEDCDNNSAGTSAAAGGREMDCVIVIKKGFHSRALPSETHKATKGLMPQQHTDEQVFMNLCHKTTEGGSG